MWIFHRSLQTEVISICNFFSLIVYRYLSYLQHCTQLTHITLCKMPNLTDALQYLVPSASSLKSLIIISCRSLKLYEIPNLWYLLILQRSEPITKFTNLEELQVAFLKMEEFQRLLLSLCSENLKNLTKLSVSSMPLHTECLHYMLGLSVGIVASPNTTVENFLQTLSSSSKLTSLSLYGQTTNTMLKHVSLLPHVKTLHVDLPFKFASFHLRSGTLSMHI
jgi:hypothetical protein